MIKDKWHAEGNVIYNGWGTKIADCYTSEIAQQIVQLFEPKDEMLLSDEKITYIWREYFHKTAEENLGIDARIFLRDNLCQTQLKHCDPLIRADERKENWIDTPDKRGDYWVSCFCEGRYVKPRIISVIDYERPDRGLEVQYEFPRDTIPVKIFCTEYYPKAKWLFITTPNWQALRGE